MTPRRLTTLLAVLAVSACSLGLTATANAARGMEVAMQDDATFVLGLKNPFKGLDKARGLHTTYIRANIFWNSVVSGSKKKKKPKRVRYDWDRFDDLISRAGERGMAVELTLTGPAPHWAAKKSKDGLYVQNINAKRYGEFARAAARHFTPLGVKRYSILNEPNLRLWLSPLRKSPRIYRKLYAKAYGQIKAVDSSNQVLIGETAPYGTPGRTMAPLKWLRGVTCVNSRYKSPCGRLQTDGYAHHPYDFKHKPTYKYPGKDNVTLATLSRLTKALGRLRASGALRTPSGGTPGVYLTEYGYFAGANYKLPQKKQAKYLVKGFTMAQKNKHVKQMLQYLLVPPPPRADFFATQIMNARFKPLKAYTALKKWANREAARGGIATTP